MTWEASGFPTAEGYCWGSLWGRWGIRHARGRRYLVYLIGGHYLTEFDRLRCARRFCEAIDGRTDWSRPHAELVADHELGRAMHRAGLRVTGAAAGLACCITVTGLA